MKKMFKDTSTIFVTGGCGFIGINLIKYLLQKTNSNIIIYDNFSTSNYDYFINLNFFDGNRIKIIEGDIKDYESLNQAMSNSDYVINLAAQVGVIESISDPIYDAEINIMGLINVLRSACENKIKCLVHASSAAPLGEQIPPLSETNVPSPLSPYGASKLSSEGYCSAFSGTFSLNTCVLRFSNVYGRFSFGKTSVASAFIKKMIKNEPCIIYGDGKQTRDFIYVKDICQAIFQALKKNLKGYNLFQIGTGIETSVIDFFTSISSSMSERGFIIKEPVYLDTRPGEIIRNFCDISKAKNELSYTPDFTINEGLSETVLWFTLDEQK